jgi:hypothetical protein
LQLEAGLLLEEVLLLEEAALLPKGLSAQHAMEKIKNARFVLNILMKI